jgi:glutathione synthase/RimK-type ligase-like ATP-grasp enzyme
MAGLCILTPGEAYPRAMWEKEAGDYRRLFGSALDLCPWDVPDFSGYDLIMPLLVWDYPQRQTEWFAALDRWETEDLPLANPVGTLRWNSDKAYLLELARAGMPVVPTLLTASLDEATLCDARTRFACDTLIVKPAVSGGAIRTYRLMRHDPIPDDADRQPMLIQPILPAIASEGEYSLFHFGGRFSHAIVKRPAAGDFRVQFQFGGRDEAVAPSTEALACAEAALAACPGPPLYARTDLLRDESGRLVLMELELIEPSLFLHHAPDGGAAFAQTVRAAC